MERRTIFKPQRYVPGRKENEWFNYLKEEIDPPGLAVKEIDSYIGKGVFAERNISSGSFLMEYHGELIHKDEAEKREKTYPDKLGSYILYFKTGRTVMCVDATFSTKCGRYVNDGTGCKKNAELKVVYVRSKPHVVLFATKNICIGEEIRYDYGVSDLLWRKTSNIPEAQWNLEYATKECAVRLERCDLSEHLWYENEDGTLGEVFHENTPHSKEPHEEKSVIERFDAAFMSSSNDTSFPKKTEFDHPLLKSGSTYGSVNTRISPSKTVKLRGIFSRTNISEQADAYVELNNLADFVATKLCEAINNSNCQDASESTGECESQENMSSFMISEGQPAMFDILDELQLFSGNESSSGIYDAEEQVPKLQRDRGEQTDVSELNSYVITNKETEKAKDDLQNNENDGVGVSVQFSTNEDIEPLPRSNKNVKRKIKYRARKETTEYAVQSARKYEKEETSQHVASDEMENNKDGIQNDDGDLIIHYITVEESKPTPRSNEDIKRQLELEVRKERSKTPVQSTERCEKAETSHHVALDDSKNKLTIKESQRKLNTVSRSRKPHRPCPYCHCMKSALTKHLIKKHHNEVEVKHAIALPKQDRNRAFTLLKRKGIMTKNMTMLRNKPQAKKDLIRERKCSTHVNEQLTYCSKCFGFFSKTYFHKHRRTCHLNESSIYLPYAVQPDNAIVDNAALEKYQTEVLDHFQNDDIGIICKSDEVIIAYGKKKFQKLLAKKDLDKYDDKKRNIRSEMRRVGNLFKEFQEICEKNKTSCVSSLDMFNRGNFYHLEEAIEQVTTKTDGSIKAGPRKDIGYLIKRVCHFLHGKFSVEEKEEKVTQLDKFLNVLTFYWADIFGEAESSLVVNRETRLRKPLNLPKQKDVKLLRDYTLSKIKILTDDKYNFIASKDYKMLRTLVISRLTLFNARRGGEPSCLLIRQWKDAENNVWLTENDQGEDPAEKALIGKFKVAYQSGKGGKLVPLLILNDCWEAMRKLCDSEIRLQAGIHPQNNYVFPQTQYSTNHALGWQAVQECCVLAGLGNKINATTMRHYVSTVYASLEVSETERESFYSHMGHSAEMNKHVYQSPLARQEVTRVGKFLHELDQGSTSTVIYSRVDGGITHATSSEVTERIDEGRGCCKEATDINIEMMDEGQKCSEEATGIKVKGAVAKTRAKYEIEHERERLSKEHEIQRIDNENGKEIDENGSLETTSELSMNVCVSVSNNAVNTVAVHATEECENETIDSGRSPVKDKRQYQLWCKQDTETIRSYFNEYVLSLEHLDSNKGNLPGVIELKAFLEKFPNILRGLAKKERINKLRTKIFNERKLAREKVQRAVKRGKAKHKVDDTEI